MLNHKYLLYVFLITTSGGCSQALFAAAEAEPVMGFPTYAAWEAEQRLNSIPAGLITPGEYAQNLRKQVAQQYPALNLKIERYDTYVANFGGEGVFRAERLNPVETYKTYLQNLIQEQKKQELQAAAAAAETGPARDMSPEEWARFIQGLPRGVDVLPLQLAEPTCADVGMTTRDAGATMFITVPGRPMRGVGRSVAEINIEPSDTWLTFKNKISAATGIPVDRISIVSQARRINQLAPHCLDGKGKTVDLYK